MMKNYNKKVFLVITLLLAISIGFSYLSTSMRMVGLANLKGNTWDIHFDNVQIKEGSIELSEENTPAQIIEHDKTTVNFSVNLDKPGDFYSFSVDVVNAGTIDAMIGSINKAPSIETLPGCLEYNITYRNNTSINEKDLLTAGKKIELYVTVKYKEDLGVEDLEAPTEPVNFSFNLDYVQATDEAKPIFTNAKVFMNNSNISKLNYQKATEEEKNNMWQFSHGSNVMDYRFIGKEPNNYISYNNETWRIIGVFDGRIKIIKDERIDNTGIRFDYKDTGVGTSSSKYGSNNWKDAQVMYFLNGKAAKDLNSYTRGTKYVKDSAGNIIYEFGKRPENIVVGAKEYAGTASTWKISDKFLDSADEVTYTLGGYPTDTSLHASDYYNLERGTSDVWQGKVGLMYASDYVYTFGAGVDDNCFTDANTCTSSRATNSWLYKPSYYQWTITPVTSESYYLFAVNIDGFVDKRVCFGVFGIRPVVYLSKDTELTGTGTKTDMYEIY